MKISVCMVTYNHQDYIAQAIESVLMQKTDFPFELVIGDDFSSDETRLIVDNYCKKYPSIIRKVYQEKHEVSTYSGSIPGKKNFMDTFLSCKGDYVCFLDGDDYWIDDTKIQQQAKFLDENLDYNIVFHDLKMLKQKEMSFLDVKFNKKIVTYDDLAASNMIYSSTVMFRNHIKKLPVWFDKVSASDWPIYLILLEKSLGFKLPICGSVYRVHSSGVWTSQEPLSRLNKWIYLVETCSKNLKQSRGFKLNLAKSHLKKIKHSAVSLNFSELKDSIKYFFKVI